MSATRLLVLGFVRTHHRAHGYLVGQELLAWNADKWANTKTGSIYHALRQLSKEGSLVEFGVAASEVAPARTEYEVSAAGETEFHALMEHALTVPDARPDMFCAGLVLMPALPRAQVISLLEQRLETLGSQRGNAQRANGYISAPGTPGLPQHVDVLVNFWIRQTECAYSWVEELIGLIKGGAYVFSDEDPGVFGAPGANVSIVRDTPLAS